MNKAAVKIITQVILFINILITVVQDIDKHKYWII